jgi:hypothetical protein
VSEERYDEEPEPDGRRYPSTVGGLFYLVVLLATAVGIGIVWSGNWRPGTEWMGAALIFAAVGRLVLPRRDAGMLAVRHRIFDVLLLAAVGATMIVLAITIPNQPL